MQDRLRIVVPAKLIFRDAVGALVGTVCTALEGRLGMANLSYQVVSSFNEAFNNVVLHGYRGNDNGQVEVNLLIEHDRLELRIVDDGSGFELSDVGPPNLEALPERGLGVFIMRSFMSHVSYERGKQNVLSMVKYLEARSDRSA